MDFDLKNILKALLLSTSEPLDVQAVQKVVTRYHDELEAGASQDAAEAATAEDDSAQDDAPDAETPSDSPAPRVPRLVTAAQVREAMDALSAEFLAEDPVFRLVETAGGYRLATAPAFADWVRMLRDEPRPQKLSQAALETLAIVAYRQPVTRAEMESIRGVSIDSAINRLIEMELVHVTGRADLPGRPLQYGTTQGFLEFCGVTSLDDLPASDVLSGQRLDSLLHDQQAGQQELSDQDMGLPGEDPTAPETEES
ncbi:MAG: SMC-Scp complex subunit ScpB [Opitutales bacterium]